MKIHNFCINYSSVANHEREREREKKTPREKKGESEEKRKREREKIERKTGQLSQ